MHPDNHDRPAASTTPADWSRDATQAAATLVTEITRNPWGTMSPSVYETARLARIAPWLDGHGARCAFLLRTQHLNGWWGHPDGYDLVPTLSATEALLNELDRPATDSSRPPVDELARAAFKGLRVLANRLDDEFRGPVPDTIGSELLIPWLVDTLNSHLAAADGRLGACVMKLPQGVERHALARLRTAVAAGRPLPEKVWHTLEALGDQASEAPGVRLVASAVGSSPAATAAWLSRQAARQDAPASLLARAQDRWGGPVPGVISIAVFERAWVLSWLLDAGVPITVPPELTSYLENNLGATGAPAGPGLPTDSDDTAAVLHALALAGRPVSADSLWAFQGEGYFQCFLGERTPSTSTNAHVLEALHAAAPSDEPPTEHNRRRAAACAIEHWLLAQQHGDGFWADKWHASPYYATMCCALALARGQHAGVPSISDALARAGRWTLDTQRADGSWGRWEGTVEETSYAVQTLLRTHPGDLPQPVAQAVTQGCQYLMCNQDTRDGFVPLWHDKDLYAPGAVIRAARIAALYAAAVRWEPSTTLSAR
ncbi:prenyltransferase [Streptomyces nitrosporeus]|uniref:prenyltransferase n=1 Tax=Streptomyces nitrosporeus TaxID=28894 RepID=UPI0039A0B058